MPRECHDGIRTAPSNGKVMLIDKNILGQEALNVLLSLNVFHSSPRLFQPLALVVSRSMKNKRKKWRKKDSNIHNNEKAFSDYLDHTIAIYTIATLRIKFYLTVKTQNQEYWNIFRYKAYYFIITRFLATYLANK